MAGQRVYRTLDGKHVPEGHEDAAFLAYTEHDELPKGVADELAKPKSRRKPADKARGRQADKSKSDED